MKNFLSRSCLLLITFFSAVINSCTRATDKDQNLYFLVGNASGSQEVPAVSTQGTATFEATYNATNNTLKYSVVWSGLSSTITAINLHGPSTVGVSGELIAEFAVNANTPGGRVAGSIEVNDMLTKYLLSGNIYYNITTANYPKGEIRGQIFAIHE